MKRNKFILLFIFVILIISLACNWKQEKKEPSIYLLPKSIRGEVIIVHDFKKGEKSTMSEKKRIYSIPKNGILFSQESLSYGLTNDDYYLVGDNGNRKTIFIEVNTNDNHEICIYNIVTGILSIENNKYPYEAFMVCRKDSIRYYSDYKLELH